MMELKKIRAIVFDEDSEAARMAQVNAKKKIGELIEGADSFLVFTLKRVNDREEELTVAGGVHGKDIHTIIQGMWAWIGDAMKIGRGMGK